MYWESQRGHLRIQEDLQDHDHCEIAASAPVRPAFLAKYETALEKVAPTKATRLPRPRLTIKLHHFGRWYRCKSSKVRDRDF